MDTLPPDQVELRGLAERYAIAADDNDPEAFAAVFQPDGALHVYYPHDTAMPSSQIEGHARLADVPPGLAARFEQTLHLIGQSHYEVKSDRAHGVVYCVAHHVSAPADGATDLVMYMRYRDTCRRDGNGDWRIAQRVAHIGWTERRPVHEFARRSSG